MDRKKTGQFLKELHNAQKLTQAELGEMLGVSEENFFQKECASCF